MFLTPKWGYKSQTTILWWLLRGLETLSIDECPSMSVVSFMYVWPVIFSFPGFWLALMASCFSLHCPLQVWPLMAALKQLWLHCKGKQQPHSMLTASVWMKRKLFWHKNTKTTLFHLKRRPANRPNEVTTAWERERHWKVEVGRDSAAFSRSHEASFQVLLVR